MIKSGSTFALAVLLVLLQACGQQSPDENEKEDDEYSMYNLDSSLFPVFQTQAIETRGKVAIKMSDLTEFDWDKVHLFSKSNTGDFINRRLGAELINERTRTSHPILVFMNDQEVAEALLLKFPYDGNTSGYDVFSRSDAWVQLYPESAQVRAEDRSIIDVATVTVELKGSEYSRFNYDSALFPVFQAQAIETQGEVAIKMSELTDFDWDKVHLVGLGNPGDAVNEWLGIDLIKERWSPPYPILVFMNGQEIAEALPLKFPYNGNTSGYDVFSRSDARVRLIPGRDQVRAEGSSKKIDVSTVTVQLEGSE